jgi:hypothetical protein
MKPTRSIIVVLFVLLTAQIASAYFCPSTGRWLSRDPIGEPGFQALQTASLQSGIRGSTLQPSGRWVNRDPLGEVGVEVVRDGKPDETGVGGNTYLFVRNDAVDLADFIGLDIITIGPEVPCDSAALNGCRSRCIRTKGYGSVPFACTMRKITISIGGASVWANRLETCECSAGCPNHRNVCNLVATGRPQNGVKACIYMCNKGIQTKRVSATADCPNQFTEYVP